MDKQEFNALTIDDQVGTFNALLEGNSIRHACTQIGVAKTTIRDRFKKYGYLFNPEENKYLFSDIGRIEKDKNTKNITKSNVEDSKTKGDITESNITVIDNDMIVKMYEELQEVILMKDELKELLKAKKHEKNIVKVETPKLVIHEFKEDPKAKTLKYYGDVLTMLDAFMKDHKNFTQQEVVSQALYEFLIKYK